MLHPTSLLSSSLTALSFRALSNVRHASQAAAVAAGNVTTQKKRRRSRADVESTEDSSTSTSTSTSSSTSSTPSPDAWRASLPDDASAAALAAALRRSLSLSGTKPESALVFVAERVRTAADARAAFDAAAALRAARVKRGQRGELRPGAHAALTRAAVRAAAAEIAGGGEGGNGSEEAVSELLASTLGRARQAGMPVGAKTFSDAAWGLQCALSNRASDDEPASSSSSSSSSSISSISSSANPLLASAARAVLAASLRCRVAPTPTLAAALLNASAAAGGEGGAGTARALAAEFEANGVRLSPFAMKALERAGAGAAPAVAEAAEEVEKRE